MTTTILTQDILKELLHYNPDTGVFTWKHRERKWFKTDGSFKSWNTRFSGKEAGGVNGIGYTEICFISQRYYAHRLAFLYMTGHLPLNEVDHINGAAAENRWRNLRAATKQENLRNSHISKDNTSGVTGVTRHTQTDKWVARINFNGKSVALGCFDDIAEAQKARKNAEMEYGYHENHGRAVD